MLFRVLNIRRQEAHRFDELVLRNALTEAAVLYARSLCEAFLEGKPKDDDIRLSCLFAYRGTDVSGKFNAIKSAVAQLKAAYGHGKDPQSPRYVFNKMVMHSTTLPVATPVLTIRLSPL
jgi:hypothetical protein